MKSLGLGNLECGRLHARFPVSVKFMASADADIRSVGRHQACCRAPEKPLCKRVDNSIQSLYCFNASLQSAPLFKKRRSTVKDKIRKIRIKN